jgi:hypothetical protein
LFSKSQSSSGEVAEKNLVYTGSQYLVSTHYKGGSITLAGTAGNFIGGGIGSGIASPIHFNTPWQSINRVTNDFFVPGAGTLFGGGIRAPIFEYLLK